jgi:hypothetical protein
MKPPQVCAGRMNAWIQIRPGIQFQIEWRMRDRIAGFWPMAKIKFH